MKNNKTLIFSLFLVVVLAQWLVVISMISKHQATLNSGKLYKFKTQPVDPNDPFRGKYVQLSFEQNSIQIKNNSDFNYNDEVYVIFSENDKNFAIISKISYAKPENNPYYLKTKIRSSYAVDTITKTVTVQYPFDRYYMQEQKAPEAERIYNQSLRDTLSNTYAEVYIKNGIAVLKDVKINEVSLRELSEK